MNWSVDARVPVLVNGIAGAEDVVLAEAGHDLPPGVQPAAWFEPSRDHQPGCVCCVVRSPSAMALAGLFAARARGTIPFFRRVVALPATPLGEAEVRAALADPLVSGRFRLVEGGDSAR